MSAELGVNTSVSSAAEDYEAYLKIRTALFHFGRLPLQLEGEKEIRRLSEEVMKQQAINLSVQSSPEYARMVIPDKELEQAIGDIYAQLPGEIDLDAVLREYGLTRSVLREAVELDLRVAAVLNYVGGKQSEVNDVDAELFYQIHGDRFVLPERRKARHILVTVNDDFIENRREAALARINKVRKELIKKPFKFARLAKSTSECPTALEGGVLGTVAPGQLYPEVDVVLFALDEGAVSEVVESPLGFHVLWCEVIVPSHKLPFNDVKEKIRDALSKRNQRVAQRQWLQQRMSVAAATN